MTVPVARSMCELVEIRILSFATAGIHEEESQSKTDVIVIKVIADGIAKIVMITMMNMMVAKQLRCYFSFEHSSLSRKTRPISNIDQNWILLIGISKVVSRFDIYHKLSFSEI